MSNPFIEPGNPLGKWSMPFAETSEGAISLDPQRIYDNITLMTAVLQTGTEEMGTLGVMQFQFTSSNPNLPMITVDFAGAADTFDNTVIMLSDAVEMLLQKGMT